ALHQSLENTEKIRILMGIGTDSKTLDYLNETQESPQHHIQFSHAQTKKQYVKEVVKELEGVEEEKDVEEGIHKFKKWLNTGKLQIKAYPSRDLHAKLYIMTFENAIDKGRVITGSSNFSRSGLMD